MWQVHHSQGYLLFLFFFFSTRMKTFPPPQSFLLLFHKSSQQPDDNRSLSLAVFHAKIRTLLLRQGSCTLPPPLTAPRAQLALQQRPRCHFLATSPSHCRDLPSSHSFYFPTTCARDVPNLTQGWNTTPGPYHLTSKIW